jgi:osmotically-inducible protein OsmY
MVTDMQDSVVSLNARPLSVRRHIHPAHCVANEIRSRFESSSYVELRNVEPVLKAGHLTLTGEVSTFYLKQLATSLAGGVEGVMQIDNRLDVLDFRTPMRPFPAK